MAQEKYYLSDEEQNSFFENNFIIINDIKYTNETVFMDAKDVDLIEKIEKIRKKLRDYKPAKNEKYIQLLKILTPEEAHLYFSTQASSNNYFVKCFVFIESKNK